MKGQWWQPSLSDQQKITQHKVLLIEGDDDKFVPLADAFEMTKVFARTKIFLKLKLIFFFKGCKRFFSSNY